MMEGITTRKRVLKTPFDVYEVFWHGNFLNFVWRPKNWTGPNKESFVVPPDAFLALNITRNKVKGDNWFWFHTLDEATDHCLAAKFTKKL